MAVPFPTAIKLGGGGGALRALPLRFFFGFPYMPQKQTKKYLNIEQKIQNLLIYSLQRVLGGLGPTPLRYIK